MYRNCKCQKCNHCGEHHEDMMEDICDDVNYCDCNCNMNECECGFEQCG